MDIASVAAENFRARLAENLYPGRGLIIGREPGGGWLQVYFIMGRSEQSRNRHFVVEGTTLRTEAVDPSKVDDPSLIIYRAMAELPGVYVVTNGDQTDTVVDELGTGGSFEAALATREREPDAPNYTPRISGVLDSSVDKANPVLALNILRANDDDPARTDRSTFRPAVPAPGFGLALTTYEGDGSPLPPFRGDPLWMPLSGNAESVAETYWSALDADNRVALAVKAIDLASGASEIIVRNRFKP
jgi:IMP cyclohydrolase